MLILKVYYLILNVQESKILPFMPLNLKLSENFNLDEYIENWNPRRGAVWRLRVQENHLIAYGRRA